MQINPISLVVDRHDGSAIIPFTCHKQPTDGDLIEPPAGNQSIINVST